MARGVMVVAETRAEAEQHVLSGGHPIRVLRSKELDLAGIPPLAGKPLGKHWIVVVEMVDPAAEARLNPPDDPETVCERETRSLYLTMATAPDLLITGSVEEFDCPACARRTRAELPPRREAPDPEHTSCEECGAHLKRRKGTLRWALAPLGEQPLCVFCGAPADSHEHVIPKWISKRLGIKDFLSAKDAFHAGNIEPRRHDISFAGYRARIMCTPCNTHFKHLEDAVIPLLVPMARGRTLSIDQETQALLALWASKTAIALVSATPELKQSEAVPAEHRRVVREEARVAPDTYVAFLPWSGGPVMATGQSDVPSTDPQRPPYEAYSAILAFGKLAFRVVGFAQPPAERETIEGQGRPLVQLWPPTHYRIDWPASAPADNRILSSLLNRAPLRYDPRSTPATEDEGA